ncbi:MAG: ATP-binding protein [Terracidiphilus sp.]
MPQAQVKLTEFDDLIQSYLKDFVGRRWLIEKISAALDEHGCRFIVLTGGPGVGKSAVMSHLAATNPQWLRYFIRRDSFACSNHDGPLAFRKVSTKVHLHIVTDLV